MGRPRILLTEDDKTIVETLTEYLREEGFDVVCADGFFQASGRLASEAFDLALLDVSLRDGDGFKVCTLAKEKGLPVIFLTASSDEGSVVKGLDMGADDYISKPFRPRELLSRIKSVLRRYSGSSAVISLGNVEINTDKCSVSKNGRELQLSALEYRLLMTFASNRGRLLTRNMLLEEIWDAGGDFVNDNTLTVYIKRLRGKIEDDPQEPVLIKTVRGLGYRMD